MASFCTKCGAALNPDSQFCTACGASASNAPAPVANYTQPYVAAATVPVKSGGPLKIIIIIVGAVVVLGIIGASIVAFTAWRMTRGIHVDTNGDHVTVQTPGGSISTDKSATYSAAELGTDVYPGAKSGEGSMKMDMPTGSMVTGIFVTSDSKDKVLAFYKSKLGSESSVMDTAETAIITLKQGEKESVMVTITANKSENDAQTQIAIVHTKSTGNN